MKTKIVSRLILTYARLRRGLTLGVRGIVVDDRGRLLMVRHRYVPGWYLPGGGVEPAEAVAQALRRELKEEAGVRLTKTPDLFGVYLNATAARRDHVVVYLCRSWTQDQSPPVPNLEILDCRFFAPGALPDETSPGTRRRIAEFTSDVEPSTNW
jgi:8-oxo-dGTP pyrophosphatase MutT (NUDIX family)